MIIKPLFSDKQKALQSDIILVENNKITSDKKEVAEKLNHLFIETVNNLDIELYTPEKVIAISSENMDGSPLKR